MAKRKTAIRWGFAAALIVFAVVLLNIYVNREAQVLARDMIAAHFHSDVQLKSIHVRLLPFVRITGEDLVLVQNGEGAKVPFVTAQNFEATTSFWNMLTRTRQLHHVKTKGLVITVMRHAGQEAQPGTRRKVPDFNIDELVADDAVLAIMPKDRTKRSLIFKMHHLLLTSVGKSAVMHYRARLENALPPGEIEAEGNIGPWNFDDSGATRLDGQYEFRKADLGVFKSIAGTLSSTGSYQGELSRLEVSGTTDTPDFKVAAGDHAVDLKTQFAATVDGTNGNTELKSVEATFLNSSFEANGFIYDIPGPEGHIISLSVTSKNARVEDMLKMAVKTPPAMQGELKFKSKVRIDPGSTPVRDRITAQGEAWIANGFFRNATVQQKIAELSHKAEPGKADDQNERVPAKFRTRFTLEQGKLKLPLLDFNVPGAEAKLHGTYYLTDETLNFTGIAMLQATVSQLTTGFKSLLLKAVDPLFKTKNAGTVLPITITGTRQSPKFKVQIKRLKEAKHEASAH